MTVEPFAYPLAALPPLTGLSEKELRRAVLDGALASMRKGRKILVTPDAVRAFLAALPTKLETKASA